METKGYEIVDKTVKLIKDCRRCDRIDVCKFHAKMKSLCESNEFYTMQPYLEWNNSLEAFERYASCQYFTDTIPKPKDGLITEDNVNIKMLYDIIRIELKKRFPVNLGFEYNSEKREVSTRISFDTESIIIPISELIVDYKFV
jgi:hypothetical protein